MATEQKIIDWYNNRHLTKGQDAWRPEYAYSIFLDYLAPEEGRTLLDIGCGTGYLLKQASKRKIKTFGIDISPEAVKIARRVSPDSEITTATGEHIPFPDGKFDYVCCIGALEHFLSIRGGLQEMKRVTKKDARFCIVVPNRNYLFWKFKKEKGTEQLDINEHLLSLDEWKNIFKDEGLKISNIYQDKWLSKKISIFNSANLLKVARNAFVKSLGLLIPLPFAYQFIFTLEKKTEKAG